VTRPAHPALLWFGVLAAPLAWVAQLLVSYAVEEAACTTGAGAEPVLGSGDGPILAAVSVVALAVALAGIVAAALSWRFAAADPGGDPRGRVAFLAGFGLLAGVVFVAVIALGAAALLPLDTCEPG
jgi:hypothetical protein